MWQWESTNTPVRPWTRRDVELSSNPCAGRNARIGHEKRGQALLSRSQYHPVRLDAHQLCWLEVGDDDNRAADELLWTVCLCDAGDDCAFLGPDVDAQLDQLFRLRYGFSREHLGNPQIDLHEVVKRDPRVIGRRCGCRLRLSRRR